MIRGKKSITVQGLLFLITHIVAWRGKAGPKNGDLLETCLTLQAVVRIGCAALVARGSACFTWRARALAARTRWVVRTSCAARNLQALLH